MLNAIKINKKLPFELFFEREKEEMGGVSILPEEREPQRWRTLPQV